VQPVTVKIGRPYSIDNGNNFVCPFEIDGFYATSLKSALGLDSVQALWSALRIIGVSLHESDAYRRGDLKWVAGQSDLGFPIG
jgi:hypothetical protein